MYLGLFHQRHQISFLCDGARHTDTTAMEELLQLLNASKTFPPKKKTLQDSKSPNLPSPPPLRFKWLIFVKATDSSGGTSGVFLETICSTAPQDSAQPPWHRQKECSQAELGGPRIF